MQASLPHEAPVMTLSKTVLLPQTVMPLYIFERKHRRLLADALAGNRAIVIANDAATSGATREYPSEIATLGLIRLSSLNEDGTSTIMLYGAERVRIESVVKTSPYLVARLSAMRSEEDCTPQEARDQRQRLITLVERLSKLLDGENRQAIEIGRVIDDPEAYVHFVMQTFCTSAQVVQRILETTRNSERLQLATEFFARQVAMLSLLRSEADDPENHGALRN